MTPNSISIISNRQRISLSPEDIAKGVFVPVSSLPQREPMKGVQTA